MLDLTAVGSGMLDRTAVSTGCSNDKQGYKFEWMKRKFKFLWLARSLGKYSCGDWSTYQWQKETVGSLPSSSDLNTFLHAFEVQDGRKDFTVSGNPYIILVNSSNSNEEWLVSVPIKTSLR